MTKTQVVTVKRSPGRHGARWGVYIDGKLVESFFGRDAAMDAADVLRKELAQ